MPLVSVMPESVDVTELNNLMALPPRDMLIQTAPRKDLSAASLSESSGSPTASDKITSAGTNRDSTWLQVEVCRDFRRDICPRGDLCRFAHPETNIIGKDGKVTCCYDFLKVMCSTEWIQKWSDQ